MDVSHWEFNAEQEAAAKQVAEQVALYRQRTDLPIYRDAIAIDGPATLDRDDAINFKFERDTITVEAYIADPSQFIVPNSILDKAAQKRLSTLYLRKSNYPMLPRTLSDDSLSLNAGRLNPAIKISTRINTKSKKIEAIEYEKCLVEPQNITYEELSARIKQGDERAAAWNKAAIWLRGFRAKNATGVILPEYDPESGIMKTEDERQEYVSPHVVNAFNVVQEAMIMTNHASALLMKECFDSGVYRTQKNPTAQARYMDKPRRHASLDIAPYTHFTSPNRRYVDIMVHRYLGKLGTFFELDLAHTENITFVAPYTKLQQDKLFDDLNSFNTRIKEFYKDQRRAIALKWLEKVFPDTDPEKLKLFDPISFSSLLKAASQTGMINDIFMHEIESRIQGNGQPNHRYRLVYPDDAVSVFCYASAQKGANKVQWDKVRELILERLAADPQKLEEVFTLFMAKIDGKCHVSQASFITKPKDHTDEPVRFSPIASAVVATIGGKDYTTKDFAIGFSDRTSATRAKLEFMQGYANSSLVKSADPELPDEKTIYVAKELYIENAYERKRELEEAGYKLEENQREFALGRSSLQARGYKYELKITKDGAPIISVIVKRDNKEEAERIGLETAILELRGKGHIPVNPVEHTGLSTFTGRLKSDRSDKMIFGSPLIVAPKQTTVTDSAACHELIHVARTGGYTLKKEGRNIKISINGAGVNEAGPSLNAIQNNIISLLPKMVLVKERGALIIQNAPQELLQLCSAGVAR